MNEIRLYAPPFPLNASPGELPPRSRPLNASPGELPYLKAATAAGGFAPIGWLAVNTFAVLYYRGAVRHERGSFFITERGLLELGMLEVDEGWPG